MKEAVGLKYSQQREMRRFLRKSGVRVAHEGAERKAANEFSGNEFTVAELLFSAGKGLIKKPMVKLTNICEKLTKLLENQEESLTWHDGAIPESEV